MATVTKAQLEKDVLVSETRRNNAIAELNEFKTREQERLWNMTRASEWDSRLYSFIGPVSQGSAHECMETLGLWNRLDPGEGITVMFDSPGGGVFAGLALYDFLQELRGTGTQITTVVRGMAASMGGILMQAGDERVIGRNAHMLIHEVSSGSIGKVSDQEDNLKFTKRLQDRCVAILAERSTMSGAQIKTKWKKTDWWLDAPECVKFGFADRIG
jgi:ATP-dependent Clp endopeptidase proteolytic subunit ClpP